jgi:hypothetical protein
MSASWRRRAPVAVFLVYVAALLVVASRHEPWHDETDLWLFGRDATAAEWWTYLRHQGSPGLWHLLLTPLAKAGLPIAAMVYLNAAIVAAGVAVFMRWAPFPLFIRLLMPFGVFPLHEYGVVARSYGTSFTLVMAICAVLGGRPRRPRLAGLLIALLANTNIHGLILAVSFGVYWVVNELLRRREPVEAGIRRHVVTGMAIAVAGGLLSVLQLLPPQDAQTFYSGWPIDVALLRSFREAFFPPLPNQPGGRRGMLLIVLLLWLVRRRADLVVFLLCSVGTLSWFFANVYMPYLRHSGFYFLAATATLWLERSENPAPAPWNAVVPIAAGVSLASSVWFGVRMAALDYRCPFSAAPEAAAVLETFDLDSAVVVAHQAAEVAAALPHLSSPRKFWFPTQQDFGSFIRWDAAYTNGRRMLYEYGFTRARLAFPEPKPLIYVTTWPVNRPEAFGLTLRYETSMPPDEFRPIDHYYIYTTKEVGPARSGQARPGSSAPLPPGLVGATPARCE